MDAMARFMAKITKDGEHWMWTAATTGSKSTYGVFHDQGRQFYAHVWVYTQLVGPIPEGYEIDHTCRRPLCMSPECLEAVTPEENQRRNRLKMCRAGLHDLTDPANMIFDKQGRRRGCLACKRQTSLSWYHAKGRDRRATRR